MAAMFRTILLAAAFSVAVAGSVYSQTEPHNHSGASLGVITFANSGATAAQEPFLRGLALLHSFEYEQAAEAFQQAQQADKAFAMAYWAEALTYSHILWGEDDPLTARLTLERLGPNPDARLALAGTTRERQYGAAIEAFFADTTVAVRARAFADSMRKITAQYPDDVDAAAFTSLALLMMETVSPLQAEERRASRDEAIDLAERIYRARPRHPGAVHYLIHATDDPAFAARGLGAARTYALIAPDAEHALHMPAHIFLQLGLWDDVASSNERAWAASRAEVAAQKLTGADVSFHDLQWLQYAYLQQGRYKAARALIDTARVVLADADLASAMHVDARYAPGILQFMYSMQTGEWTGIACRRPSESLYQQQPDNERERTFMLIAAYQAAISAVMCSDSTAPALQFVRKQVASLKPGDPSRSTFVVAQLHIEALTAQKQGDFARAVQLLSAEANGPLRPAVGPPALLRTLELFGDALLRSGQPRDAIAAYTRALELTPNRVQALLGQARARSAAGDRVGAAAAYRQLATIWARADEDLPELAEVRTGAEAR
jgi:tetratricopeptide (TPR) repeat protein